MSNFKCEMQTWPLIHRDFKGAAINVNFTAFLRQSVQYVINKLHRHSVLHVFLLDMIQITTDYD